MRSRSLLLLWGGGFPGLRQGHRDCACKVLPLRRHQGVRHQRRGHAGTLGVPGQYSTEYSTLN